MGVDSFVNTRWSLVQAASGDEPRAIKALDELCQLYWRPIYAFMRRGGKSHHEAEDLTQGFMARFIEAGGFDSADAEKSRLRNYLLASAKHYLISAHHHAQRAKRGGGTVAMPIEDAELACADLLREHETPESIYEKEWALTLLHGVLDQLGDEMAQRGQSDLFEAVRPCLLGESAALNYRELGQSLDLSESAVKVTVHRLRRRYRQLLRQWIADTLTSEADTDAELEHLISTLRPGTSA